MKLGFWTAVVLGVVTLIDMRDTPVLGFLEAVFFWAVAWGIRRGWPWAAMAALTVVLAPALLLLLQTGGRMPAGIAIAALLLAVSGALFARAAVALFRRRGGSMRGGDWAGAAFIALVFAACCSFRPLAVPAGSMANTLRAGDHVLVEVVSPALGRTPRRGDVIVFRYPPDPKQTFVKRVVGVPGDRIRMRDKQLIRNGAPVTEPWAVHLTDYTDPYRDNFPAAPNVHLSSAAEAMLARNVREGEVVVPEGQLFVLGDNRDSSLDSRYFGFVPKGNVTGRPLLIYGSERREKFDWAFKRL